MELLPHTRDVRRRVQIEGATWGVLTAFTAALVGPLLLSRDAGVVALGVYTSGSSLFGLGAAWFGPRLANRVGTVAGVALGALFVARLVFAAIPFLLNLTPNGAVPVLIALLVVWAAGEGVALPLWTAFLAGLVGPAERARWLAWRATMGACAAVCALLPTLALLGLWSTDRALLVAFSVAAIAGLASALQWLALFKIVPAPFPQTIKPCPRVRRGDDPR